MKKTYILIISVVCILLLSFTTIQSLKKESGSLGDVKYSVLSPEAFKTTNGCGWVLLKGQRLSNKSDLFKVLNRVGELRKVLTNSNELPNADGMFIRSKDTKPFDAYGDPDAKKRKDSVGTYQEDAIRNITGNFLASNPNQGGVTGVYTSKPFKGGDRNEWGPNNDNVLITFDTSNAPNVNVAKENRPQNINLYTYIKINNNCE